MDFKNVNKSQFQFGKLKKYDKNYFCHVVYDDLEPLCIKTPVLIASSGVVKRKGRAFVDMEVPADSENFVKFVRDMDQICIDRAHKNCESWFQKSIEKEDILGAYQSIIAYESPTTLHMVLTNLDEVYNHRGEKIPSVRVKAGSSIRGEMEFIGIWVTSNWIGGYWELKNIELIETESKEEQPRQSISENTTSSNRRSARSEDEVSKFKKKYKEIYPDEEEEQSTSKPVERESARQSVRQNDEQPRESARQSVRPIQENLEQPRESARQSARPVQEDIIRESARQSSRPAQEDLRESARMESNSRTSRRPVESSSRYSAKSSKHSTKPVKPVSKKEYSRRRYSSSEDSDDSFTSNDSSDDYHTSKSRKRISSDKYSKSKKYASSSKSKPSRKYSDSESDSDYSNDDDDRKREYYDGSDVDNSDNSYSDDDNKASYEDSQSEDPIDFNKLVSNQRQKQQQYTDDEDSVEVKRPSSKKIVDKDTKKVNL
jgi:hypothetical protein